MKILHISDLHIGLKLYNRDLGEDQRYILEQITDQARTWQPGAVVIAGDIYDKAEPTIEAVTLFDYFIGSLTEAVPEAEIMIISGNHDSAGRMNLYRSILKKQRVHVIGLPPMQPEEHIERVTLQDEYGSVDFYLLPFVKPTMVKAIVGTDSKGCNLSYNESVHRLIEREDMDLSRRNVLVSHQFYNPVGCDADQVERADSEIRSVGNIDEVKADILDRFDYAALGHIHKPWPLDEFHRYCGTPLACSVSEAGQEKGSILVTLGPKGEISTRVLPLIPLRAIRSLTGTLDEICAQACDDYVTVMITDPESTDFLSMRDRLHMAFPNLLDYGAAAAAEADIEFTPEEMPEKDPYTLCTDFLSDLTEDQQALLADIINTVKGVE